MLYKPGEVSQYLDIPSSTLRRYARLFKDYLSPSAKLRRRRYTSIDLEILEKIKTLSAEGVPIDDIPGHLDQMPIDHQPIEDTGQDANRSMVSVEIRRELEKISNRDQITNDKLDQILERLDRIENKPSLLDRLFRRSE